MSIKCCKNCVPPKRHLHCHSKCPEYLAEVEENERRKEFLRMDLAWSYGLDYLKDCVDKKVKLHSRRGKQS